ncbi:MAG: hypothetical protein RL722_408 [Pseudomonadota bacterium]|jgi:nicotinamide-nucleotide amidase
MSRSVSPISDPAATIEAELPGWVARLAAALEARGWQLATAESCTGGLVAAACTERAGSSAWFERGAVSYSNSAKSAWLAVPAALIDQHGAVSEPVARAMAVGAAAAAPGISGPLPAVAASLSITGVAGPSGGSAERPVGTVCFGWTAGGQVWTERRHFDGDRRSVRLQATRHALATLVQALEKGQEEGLP